MRSRLAAGIVSFVILGTLLFFSPAAQAFILNFDVVNDDAVLGSIIKFMVSAEIQTNEVANIENFEIHIHGPTNTIICSFYTNGTTISGCDDLSIIRTNSAPFGYGYDSVYGYGYGSLPGKFEYNISLDTNSSRFIDGNYTSKLIVKFINKTLESDDQKFNLAPIHAIIDGCSIRGSDGETIFSNKTYDEQSKVNIYFPKGSKRNGKGYISAQNNRERLSYEFEVSRAVEIQNNTIRFDANGFVKKGNGNKVPLNSIIRFDKISKTISFESTDLDTNDVRVTFVKGCGA